MATKEQMDIVWKVYEMYRGRKYAQQDIAIELNISVGIIGKITRALDFHYTKDYSPGIRVLLNANDFGECFE